MRKLLANHRQELLEYIERLDKHLSELLQFYLNHHCYVRSAVSSRVGKSPRELLARERHAHWLSLLGYSPFASASNN